LQQVGDLGLSALPFIPGLGVASKAAQGTKFGVEGASLASRVASSPIARGALAGYGGGVASNLSQGQDLGQAFMPNTTNVVGTIFGASAPAIMGKLSGTIKNVSGITPDIESELARNVTPEEAQKYINTVKARGGPMGLRNPTAVDLATSKFDEAADQVSKLREAAGQVVGETKLKVGQMPLNDVSPVIEDFNNQISDRFGLSIVPDESGNLTVMTNPGSLKDISASDKSRITYIANQLNLLKQGSIGEASDVAHNISQKIDYSKVDNYRRNLDPLEGLITHVDGSLRDVINKTSPEMASANAKFSELANLEKEIASKGGDKLQRGNLLIRRATAGNSGDSQELFDKIQSATGIDLTKHAVLAKWATDAVGNESEKNLFQQTVEKGAKNGLTIPDLIKGLASWAANKTIANPENVGMNAVTGKGVFNAINGNNWYSPNMTKAGIEGGRSLLDLSGANNQ
jgi:hypothetical protein